MNFCGFFMQEIADNAGDGSVLVVTHGDGVNSSISKLIPWALVYPVLHVGFTVTFREKCPGKLSLIPCPNPKPENFKCLLKL